MTAITPRISIIIPCYNSEAYIIETLESVLAQTESSWECLVVNDGSTDRSQELIETFQHAYPEANIQLINQSNMKMSAARNNGIELAKGEWILPFDSDDILRPDALEKLLECQSDHPDVDIITANYQYFGNSTHIKPCRLPDIQTLSLLPGDCGAPALIRRNMAEAIGGYKPCMVYGYEDWEFWVNAIDNGYKSTHLNESIFLIRSRDNSMVSISTHNGATIKAKMRVLYPHLYPESQQLRATQLMVIDSDLLVSLKTQIESTPKDEWTQKLIRRIEKSLTIEKPKSVQMPEVTEYVTSLDPECLSAVLEEGRGLRQFFDIYFDAPFAEHFLYLFKSQSFLAVPHLIDKLKRDFMMAVDNSSEKKRFATLLSRALHCQGWIEACDQIGKGA
ncbi:glycosyltransferase family 2 protein [bacterium]|jgi:hypothetical protein|nr:glycosyltransferase family 2 protein [bacterium]